MIGRSSSLSDTDRRKLVTIQAQHNKLRILTYDDVLANARAHLERIVGPLGLIGRNLKFSSSKTREARRDHRQAGNSDQAGVEVRRLSAPLV